MLAENRALREVLGKALGRKLLKRFATIVPPETILAWHKRLIARKWSYPARRVGRPTLGKGVVDLVVKIARENPTWGYCRIQGALANVGHKLSSSAVASILKAHGLQPAPSRRTSWFVFLKAHIEGLAAADFLNVEVWTLRGLRTYLVLFAIRISTRRVELLGITEKSAPEFARQAARNLIDEGSATMKGVTHLIIDRDEKFTLAFKDAVRHADVKVVLTPPRSPLYNAFAERFVKTLRISVLDRMDLLRRGVAT